ncbi:MAG: FGGY-family carbohydrate kinase [Gammaproteobacteria bacterium]
MAHFLGIDIGTSGCRSCLIDARAGIRAGIQVPLPPPDRQGAAVEQDPEVWWSALAENLDRLADRAPLAGIRSITVDGTSSTLLGCSASGRPLTPALMYNDARALTAAQQVARVAPPDCAAHGPSASLAKLLWLLQSPAGRQTRHILHQADWLLGRLCGHYGQTDENNALKLGYDVINRCWPEWLAQLEIPPAVLPVVTPAGTPIGRLASAWCKRWGMSADTLIVSGTTDSTAGFLATGAGPGTGVTTLGSTLVVKIGSAQPVFAPAYGIYSHRLGTQWLVGGASNSGGAVLAQYFSAAEIEQLSRQIRPGQPTGLDYYPLVAPGERFPVNDPALAPRLDPRPDADVVFLQGILEGIAEIEWRGYRRLAELGAPWPERVVTTGGGAVNRAWRTIRANRLGVSVEVAAHQEAAYGAALLAHQGYTRYKTRS